MIGKSYYDLYARKILRTRPITCASDGQFELHALTCRKDLVATLWSLKTFYIYSETKPKLVIYEDGSLDEESIQILSKHFLNCQIIRRSKFHQDMENFLKPYQASLKFSRIESFYCALKLFGPMYYAKSKYVLYFDSDVLFFRKPEEIIGHIESGTPFYMNDYQDAYSHPVKLLNDMLGVELFHKINAGLYFFARESFVNCIGQIEAYFEQICEFGSPERYTVNRHEQTLVAFLLTKAGAVSLSNDHQISKQPITDMTVSHHYVTDGSRIFFYLEGLKRLKSVGFVEKLSI